jgi:hypothetical protein
VEFDHNAKPISNSTNSRLDKIEMVIGIGKGVIVIVGGLFILWWLLTGPGYDRYEPPLTADSTPVTMVVAVETEETETPIVCEVGIQLGTICQYRYTPTPVGVCPPDVDRGYCIYDGPLSLRTRPTSTPIPGGSGSSVYPPGAN